MNLKYREGNSNDLAGLKELAVNAYGPFEKVLTTKNWNELNKNLISDYSYSNILDIAKCFVCEIEDQLIGVAYLVPSGNPTEIYDSNCCYIRMVGVNPEYQGNGIGKKLTQNCIDYARQNKENIIALHTSEFMDSARHIYEKIGFKIVKEIKPIFGKKYWLYTMDL